MKARIGVALLSALSLIGCGLGFSRDEQIVGPYYLVAVDSPEEVSICYHLSRGAAERIPANVIALGWDDHYIVARQVPPADNSVTNFFYLDRAGDSATAASAKVVVGPLTEMEFRRKQAELKLPGFARWISAK